MAAKKESKELATIEEPKGGLPAELMTDLLADAGKGLEHVRREDLPLPFLRVLQPLSPQINKRNAEYVDGAEAGMILNSATGAVHEDIVFVPCVYQRRFTEWTPRDKGGGLVRDWGADDTILAKCTRKEGDNRDYTPSGNVLSTDATFYGLLYPTRERCLIAMTSTQLKKARKWLAQISAQTLDGPNGPFTPPLFYMSYALMTLPEKNEKGEWFGWNVKPYKPVPELDDGMTLYKLAREFRDQIEKGLVKVQAAERDDDLGKDIPF